MQSSTCNYIKVGPIKFAFEKNNHECYISKDETNNTVSDSYETVSLNAYYKDKIQRVFIKRLKRPKHYFKDYKFKSSHYYGSFYVNGKKIGVFTDDNGRLLLSQNINKFLRLKQFLIPFVRKNRIYIFGLISNLAKHRAYHNLYAGENKLSKVNILYSGPLLAGNSLVLASFLKKDLEKITDIHSALKLGDNKNSIINLRCTRWLFGSRKGVKYLHRLKLGDFFYVMRTTRRSNNLMVTKLDYDEQYSNRFRSMFFLARMISPFYKPWKRINAFFEKESSRAQESGYYVFGQVIRKEKEHEIKSLNYFIIDRESEDAKTAAEVYGDRVVYKYTFMHCLLICRANYYISSEMSNHIISARVYDKNIAKIINNKPLVFLQHGIMFAKPVDNPAAMGFWKGKCANYIYKSVICSDLEAEQFYKMGYDENDLIKCGLPKFDISYMNKGADKIFFMLTYRFWEESIVNQGGDIKETSYYKSYAEVIKKFKKHNMLDKVIVSAHPKFADALASEFSKLNVNFESNIDNALKESRIVITDYSSISYDAHHRGANVIYYWKDKDYLIKNYKAIPPVNEKNCDGPAVYSAEELLDTVESIVARNYKLDKKYEARYKMINEFSDNKNSQRLIKSLIKLNIL